MADPEEEEFVPASEMPIRRRVDTIALSILTTAEWVLDKAGPGLSTDQAITIANSAHIENRMRGYELDDVAAGPAKPAPVAPPKNGQQWDYTSQEDPSTKSRNLYFMCKDKIEAYLGGIGTPAGESAKVLNTFLVDMYADKFGHPMPPERDLKQGGMSFLIDEMKDKYAKAIPPRGG